MELDQSLKETATVFAVILLLTIVVDCFTADKELAIEIVLIRYSRDNHNRIDSYRGSKSQYHCILGYMDDSNYHHAACNQRHN